MLESFPFGNWLTPFSGKYPLPSRVGVPKEDPLFIAGNDPPEKVFVAQVGKKLAADVHTALSLFLAKFMGNFLEFHLVSPSRWR